MSPPAFKVPESPTLPKYVLVLVFCNCEYITDSPNTCTVYIYKKNEKNFLRRMEGWEKVALFFWCLSCLLKTTFKLDY